MTTLTRIAAACLAPIRPGEEYVELCPKAVPPASEVIA